MINSTQGAPKTIYRDLFLKEIPYKKIDGVQFNFGLNDTVITNDKELESINNVLEKRNAEFNQKSKKLLPHIDFSKDMMIISLYTHGGSERRIFTVYRDDNGRRIIYNNTIIRCRASLCFSSLKYGMDVVVIPKIQGYTVEFQDEEL